MVVQEEAVVGQRTHAKPNLSQVEQVLQGQAFPQVDAMRNILAEQEGAHQMVHISSLTCSRGRQWVSPGKAGKGQNSPL